MPNPAVKPASVDGTVWGTYGRADRCQLKNTGRGSCNIGCSFLFLLYLYAGAKKIMEDLYGEKARNKILNTLFRKAEISWALSDI